MALSSDRHSLIPSFLYSSSFPSKPLNLHKMAAHSSSPAAAGRGGFMIPAPNEPGKIEMYSSQFYAACAVGGILSCGLTHMAVTPLDLVRRHMLLTDPGKYKSISAGFGRLLMEQGAKGVLKGCVNNLLGFGALGACKYGLYEVFKKLYSDLAGPEIPEVFKPSIGLLGAASTEAIIRFAPRPVLPLNDRLKILPGFTRRLADGLPKFVRFGLYKGLRPLWLSQATYTFVQFGFFEFIVWSFYLIPPPKKECSKPLQLGVSFSAGFLAGAISAIYFTPPNAQKRLGQWGLHAGGVPFRMVMLGTLAGAQWCIYDALKLSLGLPTTGAPAPAATVTAKA